MRQYQPILELDQKLKAKTTNINPQLSSILLNDMLYR